MTNKNTSKDMHKNAPKGHNPKPAGTAERKQKSEKPQPYKTKT